MSASPKFSRRDMLKLLATAPAAMSVSTHVSTLPRESSLKNNIVLLVFDAWSARSTSLYGYRRSTMPNFDQWARKNALVYRQHHSAGNFTVPGTASLLTGTYPWTHRAINLGGRLNAAHANHTIFDVMAPKLQTVAYAQNVNADQFLGQAAKAIFQHLPFGSFNITNQIIYDAPIFDKDAYTAFTAIDEGLVQFIFGTTGSLFLGPLLKLRAERAQVSAEPKFNEGYQFALPKSVESYTLSAVMDGLLDTIKNLREPSFVYFHVFVPHDPYMPYARHYNAFQDDGLAITPRETHPLVDTPINPKKVQLEKLKYDAFIASWDQELIRLFDYLEESKFTDANHLFITSDHGEMHDLGLSGHWSKLMHEPLVHVPLVVAGPGLEKGQDVKTFTSNVDILPTIAHLAGLKRPAWTEGQILPGLGGEVDPERPIYMFEAGNEAAHSPLARYTISVIRSGRKLTYYQYNKGSLYEAFDLRKDPNEENNIYQQGVEPIQSLQVLLEQKLVEIGAVYQPTDGSNQADKVN